MPTFKSVLAGFAVSTAMAGGLIGLSSATASSANASVSGTTSVIQWTGCRGGCGWGWGWHRRHRCNQRTKVNVHVHNHNNNDSNANAENEVNDD